MEREDTQGAEGVRPGRRGRRQVRVERDGQLVSVSGRNPRGGAPAPLPKLPEGPEWDGMHARIAAAGLDEFEAVCLVLATYRKDLQEPGALGRLLGRPQEACRAAVARAGRKFIAAGYPEAAALLRLFGEDQHRQFGHKGPDAPACDPLTGRPLLLRGPVTSAWDLLAPRRPLMDGEG